MAFIIEPSDVTEIQIGFQLAKLKQHIKEMVPIAANSIAKADYLSMSSFLLGQIKIAPWARRYSMLTIQWF